MRCRENFEKIGFALACILPIADHLNFIQFVNYTEIAPGWLSFEDWSRTAPWLEIRYSTAEWRPSTLNHIYCPLRSLIKILFWQAKSIVVQLSLRGIIIEPARIEHTSIPGRKLAHCLF